MRYHVFEVKEGLNFKMPYKYKGTIQSKSNEPGALLQMARRQYNLTAGVLVTDTKKLKKPVVGFSVPVKLEPVHYGFLRYNDFVVQ